MTVPSAVARAAPPADGEEVCEAEPSMEVCALTVAVDLNGRGQAKFDEGDFLGAIELWQQAMTLLPESKRARLRVPLAHAYHRAYNLDNDEDHLHRAHALFIEHLESSDSIDEATRADIESVIAELEADFEAIAEAEAQAQAERDERIRHEQVTLREQALREQEAKNARTIRRIFYGVGGSAAGLGVGSLAAMGVYLALGAKLDRQGRATAGSTDQPPDVYSELLAQGRGYNQVAVTTGIIGGVLTASGVALMLVAALRRGQRGEPSEQAGLQPRLGSRGLELWF